MHSAVIERTTTYLEYFPLFSGERAEDQLVSLHLELTFMSTALCLITGHLSFYNSQYAINIGVCYMICITHTPELYFNSSSDSS